MSNILLVTSSPRGEASYSTRVAKELAAKLRDAAPGSTLVHRDLAAAPLPHIGQDFAVAVKAPAETLTEEQAGLLAASETATQELLDADTVIIAAGLINFSVPSTLKSWIDHVARAHKTFRYTAEGPEGLARNKKVYAVIASTGIYTNDSPAAAFDHARPYLKSVLGFMGMTDVEFIDVEGVGLGLEPDETILERALGETRQIELSAVA
ncbi:FMN-dependent NADH-azoreductase [Mesorhizobium xinjiangense]|uniref:FMN-dependent NADH-azoreductase n=1 Tax=Mesorhizobium xinjiangense TaxID=2678685 RepID=UPI0012ECF0A1|nr:NAD(P)H-dependent oxidoreductase [Mesorhizobium xinjiangense]